MYGIQIQLHHTLSGKNITDFSWEDLVSLKFHLPFVPETYCWLPAVQ